MVSPTAVRHETGREAVRAGDEQPDVRQRRWTTPKSRWTDNHGTRIHFVETPGPNDVLPVVFVPGATCAAADYAGERGEFGRRSIVIDLRGKGASDVPEDAFTFHDHVSDVRAVLDATGIDRFHLVTFSRGTAYGLGSVMNEPERVATITIGDYPAREIPLPEVWPEGFLEGRWRGEPVVHRVSEHAMRKLAAQSTGVVLWDVLATRRAPLLVVRSGLARNGFMFIDDDMCNLYRTAVPDVEIVTFADSNHDLWRPDPTRFATVVRAFIDRHDP
jgi:non-heme chloroperoxidase